MTMRGWRRWAALTGMAIAMSATGAQGQWVRAERTAPQGWVEVNLVGADPAGEFGERVDAGIGLQLGGRLALDPMGILSLRMDGGFLVYGHESMSVCFPVPIGCRIGAEITTTNSIVYGGIGPELAIPGAVSPYLFATAGLSWFETSSSLSGVDDYDDRDLFETRHLSDLVTAGRVGGGLRVRVGGTGSGPVMLDFGVEYHRNGVADYLREGDIVDHPNGAITIFPNRTEANLYLVRAGVSFGLGGGEPEDRKRERRSRHGRR